MDKQAGLSHFISIYLYYHYHKIVIYIFCLFFSQQQQSMVTEHLNVLYSELTRLLDHSNQDIQSQAKRALRHIFAFRMMYTT